MADRRKDPVEAVRAARKALADAMRGLAAYHANACVKCGLCLPHCPTYGKLADEGDSPRGRIALIQGWASGRLALTPKLTGHLDLCLTCRACERACPSLVAFGRVMDGAKAARVETLPPWRRAARLARLRLLARPRLTQTLARLARWHQRLGLARLSERLGAIRVPVLGPLLRLAGVIPKTARTRGHPGPRRFRSAARRGPSQPRRKSPPPGDASAPRTNAAIATSIFGHSCRSRTRTSIARRSKRMIAPREAMRCMPTASAIVIATGRPSGTIDTIWLIATMTTSASGSPLRSPSATTRTNSARAPATR